MENHGEFGLILGYFRLVSLCTCTFYHFVHAFFMYNNQQKELELVLSQLYACKLCVRTQTLWELVK